jgi:hypothetical protein
MQYTVNSVNITNSTNTVTGNSTEFIGANALLPNVKPGDSFKIEGDEVIYTISSVPSNTSLTLSTSYVGPTVINALYQIARDFTPNLGLAEINPGDRDWAIHLTNGTIRRIDTLLATALSGAEGATVELLGYPKNIAATTEIIGYGDTAKAQMRLTWTSGSLKSNFIDVRYKLSTDAGWQLHPIIVGTSTTITDLVTGTYNIEMRTISTNGTYSNWSGISHAVVGPIKTNRLELEDMKRNFQYVSWAQFAVYDGFTDSSFRAVSDPSAYPATIKYGYLVTADATANRIFGYQSKAYPDITTLFMGSCTIGIPGTASDATKSWYTNEIKNLIMVDSASAAYPVTGNTSTIFTTDIAAVAGTYKLKTADPAYLLAFANYLDSTNGGYGSVKLDVSFNGGVDWQTVLDTHSNFDVTGGTVAIATTGHNYAVRVLLANDSMGRSPLFFNYLIATDPSPWRF